MDVKMIRTIQPASALPVTRNMPYHTASVPSRNQPRNMTGIYLGLVSFKLSMKSLIALIRKGVLMSSFNKEKTMITHKQLGLI